MPFPFLDLLKIRIVGDGVNSRLKRDNITIAGHYSNSTKLESFGQEPVIDVSDDIC